MAPRVPGAAVTVEIAVDSLEDGVAAVAVGADRLELCAELTRHGVTPAAGLVRALTDRVAVPVIALVRPDTGGFVYDGDAWRGMLRQTEALAAAGADGVAFGCLTAASMVDTARCAEMVRACGPLDAVFHRAFDLVGEPFGALDSLIEAGVRRVLTAGMEAARTAAVLGIGPRPRLAAEPDPLSARLDRLRSLIGRAEGRVGIVACGGIRPENASRFVREAGCDQLHSACRAPGAARLDPTMAGALRAAAVR